MRTFGRIFHDGKVWVLEAEPHVVMRAKRLFQRLDGKHAGALKLSDTVEACREIEWFCERYPLDMTTADRVYLAGRAAKHRDTETLVSQILAGHIAPAPVETALPLRNYQLQAVELLKANGRLLLADEMGLGKSAQAIGAMADPRFRPALVVTKTALPKQWEAEIRKFAPKLTTHIITKGTPYDFRRGGGRASASQTMLPGLTPDVLILNYHKLSGWAETLAEFVQFVVYDEVQEFRAGDKTAKGAAAFMLSKRVPYRLGLSGTPIYNLGHEAWPVIETVAPGALGTRAEFIAEWCGYEDQSGRAALRDPKAFGTYVRDSGILLRRTKADVGLESPDVVRHIHTVELDSKPLDEIESSAEKLATIILGGSATSRLERMQASSEMDQLVRQATGVAKAPYVAEFVKLLVENDEQVLLFGWHHAVYDIWAERLKAYKPVFFTGKQTGNQKDAAKQAFLKGEARILVMSLRAGEGVDGLQNVCRSIVFGELDWSPAVMEQDIARIDRPGQERLVNAYYMLADEGSDPIVADILNMKRSQVEGLRNPTLTEVLQYDDGDRIKELARKYLAKKQGIAA